MIDDGSIDGTEVLLQDNFSDRIHFLRHVVNRGGGAALETGFEYIRQYSRQYHWEFVVTFDADGQMDIADMEVFFEYHRAHPEAQVIF